MRCAILLLCAGIASAVFLSDIELALDITVPILVVLCFGFATSSLCGRFSSVRPLLLWAMCFLTGLCWHLNWAGRGLHAQLPLAMEGETLQVRGVVVGLPERTQIAQQFEFTILQAPAGFYPRRVTLNYYGDADIEPGQQWQLSVRLNRPHGFANPGGFDYEGWLFQQGIAARGYVRASPDNRRLDSLQHLQSYPGLTVWVHSLRYRLRARAQSLLGDSEYGGLLIALLLGDRSGISQAQWELFSATGSNHLFVISGLHIGLVSGVCYFLALLLAGGLRLGAYFPAQKLAALCGLFAAFCYALLAGFTLPTQRAFIMIAVVIGGLFFNARYLISFRLLLALLLVLLLNPLSITSSGFWLSFVAVAALLAFATPAKSAASIDYIEPSLRQRFSRLATYFVRPQLIALVALSLPLMFFTQQLSLLSPLVNVVAIPVVGFLIVPLSFFALFVSYVYEPAAAGLLAAAHQCIVLLLWSMEALDSTAANSLLIQVSQPRGWQLLALLFAALLLLLPAAVCRRSLLVPLLLPLFPLTESLGSDVERPDSLRVHIVDVGQGLAVIVRTQRHVLLFDSGARLSPDFNLGSAVVVPALRALGIRQLDAVVISHSDNDHAGGLTGVLPNIAVDRIISNHVSLEGGAQATACAASDDWKWDGVEFRFLHSDLEFLDENNSSCVLQVRLGETGVLLPGDIEREAETALALRYGGELASSILLAPHHGSLSSSSYGFLKQVRPSYVVFSSGYRNSFGHPHRRVVARYEEFGSVALNTAETGMISFVVEAGAGQPQADSGPTLYRQRNTRYWR